MNLNFDNNWRRVLLLTKQSDKDVDKLATYVKLESSKLPCSIRKFCEQFAYEYSFDYDPASNYIWPSNDGVHASILIDKLNENFPKCASIIEKAPSSVHNLNFNDIDDFDF